METSIWLWLGFTAFVLALLAFDLGLLHRKPRTIGIRESLIPSGFYVMLAGIVRRFHSLKYGLSLTLLRPRLAAAAPAATPAG